MGYLNREDKTTEDVDEEGWFHSGDLGVQDEEGFLQITGEKNLWVCCTYLSLIIDHFIEAITLTVQFN